MAWARFTADFDYRPPGTASTIAYKSRMRCPVTTHCLNAALGLKRAETMDTPDSETAAQLKADPYWVKGDGSENGR
jgi:hypothetical protein